MSALRLLVAVSILVLAFGALHGLDVSAPEADESSVAVETCESLPDYERMVSRVERIKGMELQRNVTICTEETTGGIDTRAERGQFGRLEAPELGFFGVSGVVNRRHRTSLGHTAFSPGGGPVEIFLANESVVRNVSWISYEALVAHELSHAVEIPPPSATSATIDGESAGPRTTDGLLAGRAVSNGVAMYVADVYVTRYGGYLNVSALGAGHRNWKQRVGQSTYLAGYRYSEQTNRRTVPRYNDVNSTSQLLHPDETIARSGRLPRPNLSMDSLEHVRTDRVGELFVRELFESSGVESERAAAAAAGWTNDRIDYYRADDSTVVSWRVTWQNASERTEFVETYDSVYDYERVDALGSVDCETPGRYLSASDDAVTVVRCGD